MPVLDTGSDIHYIARMKLLGFLSPFLIVATTGDTDEDLTTSLVCLMDVPVVAAARFKGDIEDADLAGGKGRGSAALL